MRKVTVSVDAVTFHVRLTPGASRDEIVAWQSDAADRLHLAVRVRSVPEKGKANAALLALLAKRLAIPKRDIDVIRGATSRLKTVRIVAEGSLKAGLVAQLEAFADERNPD